MKRVQCVRYHLCEDICRTPVDDEACSVDQTPLATPKHGKQSHAKRAFNMARGDRRNVWRIRRQLRIGPMLARIAYEDLHERSQNKWSAMIASDKGTSGWGWRCDLDNTFVRYEIEAEAKLNHTGQRIASAGVRSCTPLGKYVCPSSDSNQAIFTKLLLCSRGGTTNPSQKSPYHGPSWSEKIKRGEKSVKEAESSAQ